MIISELCPRGRVNVSLSVEPQKQFHLVYFWCGHVHLPYAYSTSGSRKTVRFIPQDPFVVQMCKQNTFHRKDWKHLRFPHLKESCAGKTDGSKIKEDEFLYSMKPISLHWIKLLYIGMILVESEPKDGQASSSLFLKNREMLNLFVGRSETGRRKQRNSQLRSRVVGVDITTHTMSKVNNPDPVRQNLRLISSYVQPSWLSKC